MESYIRPLSADQGRSGKLVIEFQVEAGGRWRAQIDSVIANFFGDVRPRKQLLLEGQERVCPA